MGISVDFPAQYIFGDNHSVLSKNSSKPFSVLKKKSSSIAYHFVREGVAKDEWRVTYISTHDNVADLLTKPLSNAEKRKKFIGMILHHIYNQVETTDSILELHHSNGDYRFLTGTPLFGSKEITLLVELLMSWVFAYFPKLII